MLSGLMLLLALAGPALAHGVVSLNLCADDFLLTLAPERIAALTFLARDASLSVAPAAARKEPSVRPDPEAVLALHPDLVLAAAYGAQATAAALAARGVPLVRLTLPRDFAQVRAETTRIAALLGVPVRGRAALADMDRILATLPRPNGVRALFLEPRGWTDGPRTLAAAVLRAAGYRQAGDGRAWSLEAILAARPDLLIVPRAPGFPSLATDLLGHPALHGFATKSVSPALLACGGPWTALAAKEIAP